MGQLGNKLHEITDDAREQPNFFRIGYLITHGGKADPEAESIPSINDRARKALDEGFMISFLEDMKKALAQSARDAEANKAHALDVLKAEQSVFRMEKNTTKKFVIHDSFSGGKTSQFSHRMERDE